MMCIVLGIYIMNMLKILIFSISESILITYLKHNQLYIQNKSFQLAKNI